jgi:hypothetical protein
LAKELVRQDHSVTVLTPEKRKEHDEFEKTHGVEIKDLGARPATRPLPASGIRHWLIRGKRLILQLFFEYPDIKLMGCVKKALRSEKGYDLLISVAVPHPIHWGVASVWNSRSKQGNPAQTWVADCGDPFMYNDHDSFVKMPWFHYFENKFLRKADYISVPFFEMTDLFNSKYRSKFKVIPQGFKFDDGDLPAYEKNTVPTFIYTGSIIPGGRDPFSMIDYLLDKKYDFKFILYTRQPHLFKKYKNHLGGKIILRDYIPRKDLLKVLSRADFLVNVNTDSVNDKINAIPTKLIDYRIAGRPILSYEHSSLPQKRVDEFMKGNYQNQFVDDNFDRYRIENVANQFLALANA